MPYGGSTYGGSAYGGSGGSYGSVVHLVPQTTVFEPPMVQDRPVFLPDSTGAQVGLWRHYANRYRGVTVWQRSDGTFCVDTPANYEAAQTHLACFFSDDPIGPDETASTGYGGLSDTNLNYPYNPYPGSTNSETPGSYSYITNWDQTTEDFVLNPYLTAYYPGGHVIPVNQAEAVVLTEGGFGDCLTTVPAGSVPPPLNLYQSQRYTK